METFLETRCTITKVGIGIPTAVAVESRHAAGIDRVTNVDELPVTMYHSFVSTSGQHALIRSVGWNAYIGRGISSKQRVAWRESVHLETFQSSR